MIIITALSAPHGTQTVKADLASPRAASRAVPGLPPRAQGPDREKLLQLLDSIRPSKQDALSDEEFEAVIQAFCASCPDPVQARWLLLDCIDPLSDEELVDRALAMPPKSA